MYETEYYVPGDLALPARILPTVQEQQNEARPTIAGPAPLADNKYFSDWNQRTRPNIYGRPVPILAPISQPQQTPAQDPPAVTIRAQIAGPSRRDPPIVEARAPIAGPSRPRQRPRVPVQPRFPVRYRRFDQILAGVFFVVSGLENPARAQLVEMGRAMGATQLHEWSPRATHLLTVTANTPKHTAMLQSGHGRAMKVSWIASCHAAKKK